MHNLNEPKNLKIQNFYLLLFILFKVLRHVTSNGLTDPSLLLSIGILSFETNKKC